MTLFILSCDGRYALQKRPDTGLLAGLWEFPHVEGTLDESAAPAAVRGWGLEVLDWQRKLNAKHIFTHVEWHMTGYTLRVTGEGPAEFLWVDGEELEHYAVPSAFARYSAEAAERLRQES